MGSVSSRDTVGVAETSSSSSSSGRGRSWPRSFRRSFLGSACLGLPHVLSDEKNEEQNGSSKGNAQSRALPLSCSNFRTNEGNQVDVPCSNLDFRSSSSSSTVHDVNTISNAPTNFSSRSRFRFLPDGTSFRLGRASSLGSSFSNAVLSRSFSIPHAGKDHQTVRGNDNLSGNTSGSYQNGLVNAISSQDSRTNNLETNSVTRHAHRRPRESAEGTARFSRTLSVGRLRDRVLRRTSLLEGRFDSNLPEDGSLAYIHQGSERRYLNGLSNMYSTTVDEMPPTSGPSNSRNFDSSYDGVVAPQMRESNHDTWDHRSAFLERRRRIRSQVRALQRLGSRFENLSGHDRACVASGQHRTGRCACRRNNRSANPGDDTSTRTSISRIVMLAEALFEVLDEIHQQAVVLASRPSITSIGSVPAPKEVVDSMAVKIYTKAPKQENDDSAQCYICLVEYEDGDCMRVLPCSHEFHRSCVDKWLKEIHRVCPLCRGDVCISGTSPVDKLD